MDLSKAVIVVFGAGHGIGAVLAEQLRAGGATVYASALHAKEGEVTAVDVREPKEVTAFLKAVAKTEGRIDAVINSAGIAGKPSTIEDMSDKAFDEIMQANLFGTFHVLKAALAVIDKKGSIITVSSKAGHRSHPTLVAYSASKAATLSLCQGVAKELMDAGSQILCQTVSPGGVDTRMREDLFGEEDSKSQQKPEVVADAIVRMLTGDLEVPQGGDVVISRGKIEVVPMA